MGLRCPRIHVRLTSPQVGRGQTPVRPVLAGEHLQGLTPRADRSAGDYADRGFESLRHPASPAVATIHPPDGRQTTGFHR